MYSRCNKGKILITEIRHTGLVVKNLDRMLRFYKGLGLNIVSRDIEKGNFIDNVTGYSNVNLEWVKLSPPNNINMIELIKYHNNYSKIDLIKQSPNQYGCSHVAFTVENIDKAIKQITNLGGSKINEPVKSKKSNVKVVYCNDPEGTLIELVEI